MSIENAINRMREEFAKHDKAIEELDKQIDKFVEFLGIKTDIVVFFQFNYYGGDVCNESVLLQYDGDKDQFIWDYDWDEGQEFKLVGFTPLYEVEPNYILEDDKIVKI